MQRRRDSLFSMSSSPTNRRNSVLLAMSNVFRRNSTIDASPVEADEPASTDKAEKKPESP
jgi:hypothetical protein